MSESKPSLVPVSVPWQVSRSNAHLRARLSEGFIDFPVWAEFVGFFGGDVNSNASASAGVAAIPPSFQEGPAAPSAPYHLLRVVFNRGYWARFSPSVSESQLIHGADPGMYEVQFSPWLQGIGHATRVERKHYLLLAGEVCLDVIAQGWEWKLGQALSGR